MNQALGIDIGGSSIKSARVNPETGDLLTDIASTPLADRRSVDDVLELVRGIIAAQPEILPVGVGFPGVVRQGRTKPATHLEHGWNNFDFLGAIRSCTSGPVAVLNDADAAGLAEMRFGAGLRYNGPDGGPVLLITLGTGIGTALFHRGCLFPNLELGHIEIDGADAELLAAASVRTHKHLDWQRWGAQVNRYLQTIERLLSPELIIIGGGVSENFAHFSEFLVTEAVVRPARLGNAAGLVGATLAIPPALP
ncbi:MAG: ROK family protein [candidate division Zixibacteria bacterium]|nr:ROK family protein [candidate division Zixibacteria bacterium]